jgi:hypothetical protein
MEVDKIKKDKIMFYDIDKYDTEFLTLILKFAGDTAQPAGGAQ